MYKNNAYIIYISTNKNTDFLYFMLLFDLPHK